MVSLIPRRSAPTQWARASAMAGLVLLLGSGTLCAHIVTGITPPAAEAGDLIRIDVSGAAFSSPSQVRIRIFEDVAGFPEASASPLTGSDIIAVEPNTSVSVRVPSSLLVGFFVVGIDVEISGSFVAADTVAGKPGAPFAVKGAPTWSFVFADPVHSSVDDIDSGRGNSPGWAYKSVELGDVDNDGDLDVLAANSIGGESGVWVNGNLDRVLLNQAANGGSGFSSVSFSLDDLAAPGHSTVNRRTYDADLADVNGDGFLDVLRSDVDANRLLLGNGDGTFTDRSGDLLPTPAATESAANGATSFDGVASADIDGDGDLDLLWGNYVGASGFNVLMLNQLAESGTPSFTIANTAGDIFDEGSGGPEINTHGLEFADGDGDGDPDLFITDKDKMTNPNRYFRNDGGAFSDQTALVIPEELDPAILAAGAVDNLFRDLDGDGDNDIYYITDSGSQNRLYWNDGQPGDGVIFHNLRDCTGGECNLPDKSGAQTYDVGAGDFDFDGDLDLVEIANGSGHRVLRNRGGSDGELRFTNHPGAFTGGAAGHSFALTVGVGDVDLDLDIDLVTGGWEGVHVHENTFFDDPNEELDVVFLLDRTGSMVTATRNFLTPAKNALRRYLVTRRADDRVGIVTFEYTGAQPSGALLNPGTPRAADSISSKTADLLAPLQTLDGIDFDTLVDGISEGGCGGDCTSIGAAVQRGLEVLQPFDGSGRHKALVVLTDGEENLWPSIAEAVAGFPPNVRVFAIALGTDVDAEALDDLTSLGSSFYQTFEPDAPTLPDVYDQIESLVTSKQIVPPIPLTSNVPIGIAALSAPSPSFAFNTLATATQSRTDRWQFVVDPADRQVRVTLSWQEIRSGAELTLVDPLGGSHDASETDPRFAFSAGPRHQIFDLKAPTPGIWEARLGFSGGDNDRPFLSIMASSTLRCSVETTNRQLFADESILLHAQVNDGAHQIPARIFGNIIAPNGAVHAITPSQISKCKGGGYNIVVPRDLGGGEGVYRFDLVCTAPEGSNRYFLRRSSFARWVAASPQPGVPSDRRSTLTAQPSILIAGGSSPSTVELVLRDANGQPLTGRQVSFTSSLGTLLGTAQDKGGGVYSQSLQAATAAGTGIVRAIVGGEKLAAVAEVRFVPGRVDATRSLVEVLPIGHVPTADGSTEIFVRVTAVDNHQNPITAGSRVMIETEHAVGSWIGAATEVAPGVFERILRAPTEAARSRVQASINDVPLASRPEVIFAAYGGVAGDPDLILPCCAGPPGCCHGKPGSPKDPYGPGSGPGEHDHMRGGGTHPAGLAYVTGGLIDSESAVPIDLPEPVLSLGFDRLTAGPWNWGLSLGIGDAEDLVGEKGSLRMFDATVRRGPWGGRGPLPFFRAGLGWIGSSGLLSDVDDLVGIFGGGVNYFGPSSRFGLHAEGLFKVVLSGDSDTGTTYLQGSVGLAIQF